MPEIEGKGVDYERYALNRLFHELTRRYRLRSVLEIPAKGEKAMPSLYSLAFGEAGCDVHLVNAEEKSKPVWQDLGYPVRYHECPDLTATGLPSAAYDLVWNFMYIAHHEQKDAFIHEMIRLSNRYVFYIAVNRFNLGFFSHRMVHRVSGVPWSHGDVRWMNPYRVRSFLRAHGLRILTVGAVDTPPWPDSLGFRDMKLHRMNVDLNKIDWESRTVAWMKAGNYPLKIKFYYLLERLPLPLMLKLPYAHLFYVLGEK